MATSDALSAVTAYTYGPYGEPQSWAGSRFRYTGQMAIPEAQLYHYRARAYDPMMGRFLQTDPIGYGDGLNIYAYVHGDPVNGRDPTGTCDGEVDWGDPSCWAQDHPTPDLSPPDPNNPDVQIHIGPDGGLNSDEFNAVGPTTWNPDVAPSTAPSGDGGSLSGPDSQTCSAAKTFASNIATDLENASSFFTAVGVVASAATAGALVGEIPSGGADTPLTIGAGATAGSAFEISSAFGLASAGLKVAVNGNPNAGYAALASEVAGSLSAAALAKFGLAGKVFGSIVSQALDAGVKIKNACAAG